VIGTPETLDPDDSLAQMILHELCHALVEGERAVGREDWGLDNRSDADLPRERACLRLQATLAAGVGLRGFLAPTTDHRAFYDRLPDDPLAAGPEEEAAPARAALEQARRAPFAPHLEAALVATARIVREVRAAGGGGDGGANLYAADAVTERR
ncbi:MAG: YkgJ family cysteine cluster protein, partial [Planctomycetota bacterium JB042]